jgi:hypothetical protein
MPAIGQRAGERESCQASSLWSRSEMVQQPASQPVSAPRACSGAPSRCYTCGWAHRQVTSAALVQAPALPLLQRVADALAAGKRLVVPVSAVPRHPALHRSTAAGEGGASAAEARRPRVQRKCVAAAAAAGGKLPRLGGSRWGGGHAPGVSRCIWPSAEKQNWGWRGRERRAAGGRSRPFASLAARRPHARGGAPVPWPQPLPPHHRLPAPTAP